VRSRWGHHNPVTGDLYTARRGGGAFLTASGSAYPTKPIWAGPFLVHAGLRGAHRTPYWDGFLRLVDATDRQRGSGLRRYALIAEGKAEIYAENLPRGIRLKPWDLAPARSWSKRRAAASRTRRPPDDLLRAQRWRRTDAPTTPRWPFSAPDTRHPSRSAGDVLLRFRRSAPSDGTAGDILVLAAQPRSAAPRDARRRGSSVDFEALGRRPVRARLRGRRARMARADARTSYAWPRAWSRGSLARAAFCRSTPRRGSRGRRRRRRLRPSVWAHLVETTGATAQERAMRDPVVVPAPRRRGGRALVQHGWDGTHDFSRASRSGGPWEAMAGGGFRRRFDRAAALSRLPSRPDLLTTARSIRLSIMPLYPYLSHTPPTEIASSYLCFDSVVSDRTLTI